MARRTRDDWALQPHTPTAHGSHARRHFAFFFSFIIRLRVTQSQHGPLSLLLSTLYSRSRRVLALAGRAHAPRSAPRHISTRPVLRSGAVPRSGGSLFHLAAPLPNPTTRAMRCEINAMWPRMSTRERARLSFAREVPAAHKFLVVPC